MISNGLIKVENIILLLNDDKQKGVCTSVALNDGGAEIFKYEDFTVIKRNTLDGNKDLYIGQKDFDVKIFQSLIISDWER